MDGVRPTTVYDGFATGLGGGTGIDRSAPESFCAESYEGYREGYGRAEATAGEGCDDRANSVGTPSPSPPPMANWVTDFLQNNADGGNDEHFALDNEDFLGGLAAAEAETSVCLLFIFLPFCQGEMVALNRTSPAHIESGHAAGPMPHLSGVRLPYDSLRL